MFSHRHDNTDLEGAVSEYSDLYNEMESEYVELNTNVNINYAKFYEDL